jgi:hypothetical protein
MNWYLRNAEGEYGPFPFDTLLALAREARVLDDDAVREDHGGSDWQPAGNIPELGLHWQVAFPDGSISRLVHADTVAAGLANGDFQTDWSVTDGRTGEVFPLVDVACAALIARNRELEAALAAAASPPPHGEETPPAAGSEAWRRLMKDLDHYKKEEAKLRKFVEDEQVRSRQREESLLALTERFKASELEHEQQLKHHQRSRARLEEELQALRGAMRAESPESQVVTLRELTLHTQDLGRQMAHWQDQVVELRRALEQAREERDQAEADGRSRVEQLEAVLLRERQAARKAEETHRRLEQKHGEMLAAYRELSDRLIHMRNEALGGNPRTPETEGEGSPAPGPSDPARFRLR